MSLSNDLINLFEQLPLLQLTQIAANMDFHNLMKLAFKSRKWRSAIGSRKITRSDLTLKIDKNLCEVKTTVYPIGGKPDESTFILVERDNVDVQGDNVIKTSDNCYQQNLIDIFEFTYTKIPTFYYSSVEVIDAKWMRISDLQKTRCARATFGANRLKTRDLKELLLCWINGTDFEEVEHLKFQMNQEQMEKIDMKEILKDLNAVPWDPKKRDRKFIFYDSEGVCQPPIDLADGYDIRHPDGTLATIHLDLDTHTLHFCRWFLVFVMEFTNESMLESVVLANKQLARDDLTPEERLEYEEERRKDLQSLRNLRNNQNLDVTDVVMLFKNP